jgi:hypothetical protein
MKATSSLDLLMFSRFSAHSGRHKSDGILGCIETRVVCQFLIEQQSRLVCYYRGEARWFLPPPSQGREAQPSDMVNGDCFSQEGMKVEVNVRETLDSSFLLQFKWSWDSKFPSSAKW